MTTEPKAVLTEHQVSMTEWFAAIGEISEAEAFRDEDNRKAERLGVLQDVLDLPYRRPVVFPAAEAKALTPDFQQFLAERGKESCAFRLTSTDPSLPKLRNRGLTAERCYKEWFLTLEIDFDQYTLSIFPNETEISWSTIFVVSPEAIFGEIVEGKHAQLSQGNNQFPVYQFRYDFNTWQWSAPNPEAQQEMEEVIAYLKATGEQQAILREAIQAEFSHDYLCGYFETTVPTGEHHFFIDYNRVLPRYIPTPPPFSTGETGGLKGTIAQQGKAEGLACVVASFEDPVEFPVGSILVCEMTDVRFLPYMQKASAIVTAKGGMLSHAAIIARELKKPCIVGVKDAVQTLKTGQLLRVDATTGTITLL